MGDVRAEAPVIQARTHADRVIGALAEGQWGVVARWQLVARGVTKAAIEVRVRRGALLRLHPGVYAVGHRRLRREGHWLGAVLAAGPGAVLSHRDAAGLHDLRPANHARIDVTTAGQARSNDRIAVHRTRVLDAHDVTTVRGIPVTTVARTLVDLAGIVQHDHLAKALGSSHIRSGLEVAFLRLIRQAGLPKPRTNAHVEGLEVDACWPSHKLIVELDGWEFHRTKDAFQRDRERDAILSAAGWTVVRFTHADVTARPAWVVGTVASLLTAARATMSDPCP